MRSHLGPLLRVCALTALRRFTDQAGGRSRWRWVFTPLLIMGFVPLAAMFSGMTAAFYYGGKPMGLDYLGLMLGLTAGQILCLTFGVFYVMSAFYFSKDLPLLIPMPIRPGAIVLAKFVGILAGEYLTLLPVTAPVLLTYGVVADVRWTYWPMALVVFLLLPVVPLAVSTLATLVLMRITNVRQNRDLWRVLGALVMVGLVMAINLFSRFSSRLHPDEVTGLVRRFESGPVATIHRWSPVSRWAVAALREGAGSGAWGSFLLYVVSALLALLVVTWMADRLFYGGVVGGGEVRTGGRRLSRTELAQATGRVRSPLWALLIREIRLLNRTPSFLMAALLPVVLVPIIALGPVWTEGGPGADLARLEGFRHSPWLVSVAIAVVLFLTSMGNVASTAISREGRFFWISRSLPVAPRVQIHAKVLHSLIFVLINVALVLGVTAYFHLLTPLYFLAVLVGGMLAGAAYGYLGIMLDLWWPNLKWDDPQRAMRGKANALLGMLLQMVLLLVQGVWSGVAAWLAPPLVIPGLLVLYGGLAVVAGQLAGALADRRYLEIEE
jgi:ABC-2 type transport system permease protein